jgi:Family of unknown function (DUF5906)
LAISEAQGVGKTTLAEQILRPLVGAHNCSFPSANEATSGDYTGWLAFKRLVVIAEIYDGQTSKSYNRLKAAITDEWVRVNEKYEKQYDLQNFAHLFATSNSRRALKLDDDDRRWFVPGITDQGRPTEYFRNLREWLEDGGLSKIAAWAEKYVSEHGPVLAGEHAPTSAAKQQAIEESRSVGERLIAEFGEMLSEKPKAAARLDETREWLARRKASIDHREFGDTGTLKLETSEKIANIMRSCGFKWSRRFKVDGKRFRVIANFEIGEPAAWNEIEAHLCSMPM